MTLLTRAKLKRFLKLSGERLQGKWVLMGGTVLPLLGYEHRVTLDIDMVPMGESSQKGVLDLMQISDDLSLPVETINQAGAFFLKKRKHFEQDLVLLHEGSSAQIYRPNVNLFIELKANRLSESDLEDCLVFLKFAKQSSENVDKKRLAKYLTHIKPISPPMQIRLKKLKIEIEKS